MRTNGPQKPKKDRVLFRIDGFNNADCFSRPHHRDTVKHWLGKEFIGEFVRKGSYSVGGYEGYFMLPNPPDMRLISTYLIDVIGEIVGKVENTDYEYELD